MSPQIVVLPDATLLAQAAAARIITSLVDAQAARGNASLVLTGGGIATATYRELAAMPARDAVDWRRVDLWWGDERFLPAGDPERNLTQAQDVLLAELGVPADRSHPMPASDGADGDDVDAAAERYAGELAAAMPSQPGAPRFDVLMLGVGPDGHVASLFPDAPGLADDRDIIPVRHSPKPPPTRLSMSLPVLNTAREVWLIAAGQSKAQAVHAALTGTPSAVPAGRVTGSEATRWLLDRPAASQLPATVSQPSD